MGDFGELPAIKTKDRSLTIAGLPIGLEIVHDETTQDIIAFQLDYLIRQGHWNLSCLPITEDGRLLPVEIRPHVIPGIVIKNDYDYYDGGLVIDTGFEFRLAVPEAGYSFNKPKIDDQAPFVYRGMCLDELLVMFETGRVGSAGGDVFFNKSERDLTFFGTDFEAADLHAQRAGFVPGAFYPTFHRPGFVVITKRPNGPSLVVNQDWQIATREPVPVSRIAKVIEVLPYEITPGLMYLEIRGNKVWPGSAIELSAKPLTMKVVYRGLSLADARAQFKDSI